MSEVATDTPTENETKSPDDWFKENVSQVLNLLIEQTPFRSETEEVTLRTAVQNLSDDPATLLPAPVEPQPLGTPAIDPVLATVLRQNADLSAQVQELLTRFPAAPAGASEPVSEPATAVAPETVNPDAQPAAQPPAAEAVAVPPPAAPLSGA